MHDFRIALRSLGKRKSFALIAVLTLGLGIGANTAIFSVVNAVLLKAAPFPEPERLVMVWASNPEAARSFGLPDQLPQTAASFYDYQAETKTLERMALLRAAPLGLTGDGDPEVLGGVAVTGDFFRVFGVKAVLGRVIERSDDEEGAPRVAALSHACWQRRFGGDPAVVGRSLRLDGKVTTVIGVLPASFTFPRAGEILSAYEFANAPDLWIPLSLDAERRQQRDNRGYVAVARLRHGATRALAQAEMETMARRLAAAYPATDAGWGVRLDPLREQLVGGVRSGLLLLLGAVGLLLLVACGNVASLMLAEAHARRREVAVRAALGASRGQLLRPLLAESLFLAAGGGLLGLLLAHAALQSLLALVPVTVPGAAEARVDATVLLFASAAALLTTLVFGLFPGLVAWKTDAVGALKDAARSTGAGGRRSLGGLVAVQMALTAVLLVGAGLLLRSFAGLLERETGLTRDPLITFHVDLPPSRYAGPAAAAFAANLTERLRSLPGVAAAGASTVIPFSGSEQLEPLRVLGRAAPRPGQELFVNARVVTPGYFATMGIPLLKGRALEASDGAQTTRVVVVSETLARAQWPGEDPLGRRIRLGYDEDGPGLTVVGVVGDVRHSSLAAEMRGHVYEAHAQRPRLDLFVVARTHGDAALLAKPVRAALAAIDPEQPLAQMRTMEELVTGSLAGRRLNLALLGLFAALALLLAAIGVYGLARNTVTQRTREIGLRLALGASPLKVLGLVLSDSGRAVLAGALLGLLASLLAGRVLASLVFGISTTDPSTYASVVVVLLVSGLAAVAIPALRAVRVDPGVILRED